MQWKKKLIAPLISSYRILNSFDFFINENWHLLSILLISCVLNFYQQSKKKMFNFMGETIAMVPTVGIFITMNPGELSLKDSLENVCYFVN